MISARVILYSTSYMALDGFYSRFIGLVFRFVIRMWILIISPNFIRILLGWDGLGVTSYLLVIYYQSEKSFNAGIVTALTNRLGDAGLLCIVGAAVQLSRWSFYYYHAWRNWAGAGFIVLLAIAAITKSAQIPFSAWLPAAIAAPTPVSSLVHSSTLVTAGVYLLVRLNYLLATQEFLRVLIMLGLLTIFMAGGAAIGEVDMKKIIALSTLRQLGLMFITLGLGFPLLAFFHLAAHAYFKAILFMCAGGIIHSIKDFQDLRTIGAGGGSLVVSLRIFFVANIRLCGLPFITGFFSKDLILELMLIRNLRVLRLILAIMATILTVLYSLRAVVLVFLGSPSSEACVHQEEADYTIISSFLVLLIPSIIGGMLIS